LRPSRLFAALLILGGLHSGPVAHGQSLQGEWVVRCEEGISESRKTPVQLLLLDRAGKPQPLAAVRLRMLRHGFPFGLEVHPKSPMVEAHPGGVPDHPLWRCFSAISLEHGGGWTATQPLPTQWQFGWPNRMVQWGRAAGLGVRWGRMLPADPAALPAWAAALSAEGRFEAMQGHMLAILQRFGASVGDFDLFVDCLGSDGDALVGSADLRRLYHRAKAAAVDARFAIRFENALDPERVLAVVRRITSLSQTFVPFDAVTLEGRFSGPVVQNQLAQALDSVARLGKPIVIAGLEIGGATSGAAAVNTEIVLRTAFACPAVQGIYWRGLTADELADPSAALLAPDGSLTAAGDVVVGLLSREWFTDIYVRTNEIGSARAKVFAGWYEVSASFEESTFALGEVFIPPQKEDLLLVVQPLASEAGGVAAATQSVPEGPEAR